MRAVTYFFITLSILVILGLGAFFVVRGSLLNWGVSSMKDSVRAMNKNAKSSTYRDQCAALTGEAIGSMDDPVVQLRFLSSKEYVIEAICDRYSFDPILISQGTLPQYVVKVPGSSGFIFGDTVTGVELEVFGELQETISALLHRDINWISSSKVVLLNQDSVTVETPTGTTNLGVGPVTSCSGYGFTCCETASQKGVGERITGLAECSESCYAQCIARPVLLAFNPNPFFDDVKTRSLVVRPNTAVEFTVVSGTPEETEIRAVFDFGDGEKKQSNDLSRPVSHTFSCALPSCQYIVSVQLVDKWGVESSPTSISSITVTVQ